MTEEQKEAATYILETFFLSETMNYKFCQNEGIDFTIKDLETSVGNMIHALSVLGFDKEEAVKITHKKQREMMQDFLLWKTKQEIKDCH